MGNMPDTSAADLAQILATAPEAPPAPIAEPFPDGDQWLADSINELKGKDAEYARLQSAEAREQWEQIARDNLQRQREQEQIRAATIESTAANQRARDDAHDTGLLRHANELASRLQREFPRGFTEDSLPSEWIGRIAKVNQELAAAANRRGVAFPENGQVIPLTWDPQAQPQFQPQPQTQQPEPQPSRPETFPDGKPYQMTTNPDGTVEVKLITGEIFRGDPVTAMQKMAEAQVNTKRWAQQRAQSQPVANGNGNGDNGHVPAFGEWAADEQARALGFRDRNELKEWGSKINQTVSKTDEFMEEQRQQRVTLEFMARCPDFPGTEQAATALSAWIVRNGWEPTANNMEAAHAHLVRTHVYQPLTPAEQRLASGDQTATNRNGAPPPMLRSGSPDADPPQDIERMSSSQIRAEYFKQLEQQRTL